MLCWGCRIHFHPKPFHPSDTFIEISKIFIQLHMLPKTFDQKTVSSKYTFVKMLSWVLKRGGRPETEKRWGPRRVGAQTVSRRRVGAQTVSRRRVGAQGLGTRRVGTRRVSPPQPPNRPKCLLFGSFWGRLMEHCGRGSRPWTIPIVRLGFSDVILCEPLRPGRGRSSRGGGSRGGEVPRRKVSRGKGGPREKWLTF